MCTKRNHVAGMGYMHSFGIVHRDMKLENVLLSGRWEFHLPWDDVQVIKPRKATLESSSFYHGNNLKWNHLHHLTLWESNMASWKIPELNGAFLRKITDK